MDEVKTSKTVKEVFKDYNSNSFVLNAARVIGIDLYKKKNLLEVFIASNKLIDINDVLELEKYMERRFQIQTAKLTIKYELEEEVDVSEKIAKEWQSIVKYISYKHPIARAFLNNSEIQIVNNNIKVTLFLKEFLESNKFNEVFAGLIYNIYGKKYTMTYEEKVSENTVTQYKERLERLEKEAILEMTKDNGTASAEHSEKPQQSHMLVKMLDKANTTKVNIVRVSTIKDNMERRSNIINLPQVLHKKLLCHQCQMF